MYYIVYIMIIYVYIQWYVCSSSTFIHITTYNEILHYWMHALPAGSVMRRWPCLFYRRWKTCGWLWIESIDFPFIHYVYTHSIRYMVLQCLWLIYRRAPSFNISQQWRALLKHTCLMILRLTRWFINGENSHVPYNGNVGAMSHFQTHPYIIVHHQI